ALVAVVDMCVLLLLVVERSRQVVRLRPTAASATASPYAQALSTNAGRNETAEPAVSAVPSTATPNAPPACRDVLKTPAERPSPSFAALVMARPVMAGIASAVKPIGTVKTSSSPRFAGLPFRATSVAPAAPDVSPARRTGHSPRRGTSRPARSAIAAVPAV